MFNLYYPSFTEMAEIGTLFSVVVFSIWYLSETNKDKPYLVINDSSEATSCIALVLSFPKFLFIIGLAKVTKVSKSSVTFIFVIQRLTMTWQRYESGTLMACPNKCCILFV